MIEPTAIFTADWHLREDTPKCRIDDFQKAQWEKVKFIKDLQKKYDCQVIHSGDLFNHWKPSPWLLTQTLLNLPDRFYTILGNHDLPQHSFDLRDKSGVMTLAHAGALKILPDYSWGRKDPEPTSDATTVIEGKRMLVWHVMTYKGDKPWPGCEALSARQILRNYKEFDLILTGHNHKTFMEEKDNRILVNPGSLTRQKADQVDHRPCVWLWYGVTNKVGKTFLPFSPSSEAITREYLTKEKERDSRIEAFIEQLNGDWVADISFEENLERFQEKNKIKRSVIKIIKRSLEENF